MEFRAVRPRAALLAENALLRQQILVLRRAAPPRPRLYQQDRLLLVLLARAVSTTWRDALDLVQPDTLLRWHRDLFRLVWRRRSRPRLRSRRVSPEVVELIRSMARSNRLWGAARIRGELLKLGIRVSKRTIQKYARAVRPRRPRGSARGARSSRTTRLTSGPVISSRSPTPGSRALFAFVIIRHDSREIVHQRHELPHRHMGRPVASGGHAVRPRAAVPDS